MTIANLNTASITRDSCERAFTEWFGAAPFWISSVLGRVNIIGEHTDYDGGFVLPMAINRRTWIAAAPNTTHTWRVFSASLQEEHTINLASAVQPVRNSWANYVRGVVRGFQDLGARVPGLDVFIDSNVPPGGGLSSS